MRNIFCQSLVAKAADPDFVFLTGDLGFMALEPLRDALGPRFINAGVAEQNMVAVAAGLAKTGLKPWAYSIAPFIYARPFEQVRNDVCLHDLGVVLVGNGGGYGYGVMGSTHHAVGDYGALLTLPNLRVFVPAFDEDVVAIVARLFDEPHPAYFRLGRSEKPEAMPSVPYAAWRRILSGDGPCLLAVGPLVGSILAAVLRLEEGRRPSVWVLSELPFPEPPAEFLADVRRSDCLMVVEEHVAAGGAGSMLALYLLASSQAPRRFLHRAARGSVSGRYGSQMFHRRDCGLDAETILAELTQRS
jgi:transketolase